MTNIIMTTLEEHEPITELHNPDRDDLLSDENEPEPFLFDVEDLALLGHLDDARREPNKVR
jgi:hypothetical protein